VPLSFALTGQGTANLFHCHRSGAKCRGCHVPYGNLGNSEWRSFSAKKTRSSNVRSKECLGMKEDDLQEFA
jgi:Zn-finger protein